MTHTTVPWGRATRLTLVGGLAFWAANLAISLTPVAAAYRAALSISYWPMTAAALIGGLFIAGCVSVLLLALPNRIPGANPLVKATLLSLLLMALIEAFSIALEADHLTIFHLVGAVINVPRFLALGVAVGWLAGRSDGADRQPTNPLAGTLR